ncbi:DUF7139 domain-containing protein [Halospeciosus flavus]|uniref:Permease n=2 Tax=Halospeciosus flavus TaxID=3032283 RepID=A0ABD5Z251_9EURY|nr:permease [Halospeciosus flavus]
MTSASALRGGVLRWYERYLGEPETEMDVFVGFSLFAGGVAMGLLGFGVFAGSLTVPAEDMLFWQLREVAVPLAALALPVFTLGVVVLLPVDHRARYLAGGGLLVCLAAMGVFVATYPYDWNVQTGADYSGVGIAIYAFGLVVSVVATGAALVSYHVQRSRAPETVTAAVDPETSPDSSGASSGRDSVSDEQVEQDIAEAMEGTEFSWGGVASPETTRLTFTEDEVDEATVSGNFDPDSATQTRSAGVDDSVANLRKLQGREKQEATGGSTDDQAAALRELREQQRAEELATADDESVLDRVRGLFGRDES